jgi:hypothetical protein
MNGIYIGGYGQFKHLQADGEFEEYDQIQQRYFTVNETRQAQGISGGILFGYQVTKNWFTADIFVGGGPQYSWGQYRNLSIPLLDFYTRGMIMNAGFSLGMKIK